MSDSDDPLGPYLHWSFIGDVILLPSVQLNSFSGFVLGSLLTVGVCLAERLVTLITEKQWAPSTVRNSRWRLAAWRAILYWICTFLRLMYMLIAMSFHLGIILVIVTTLAVAQFFIELRKSTSFPTQQIGVREPLLDHNNSDSPYPLSSRTRTRSRPEDIYIHPNASNIARAEAVVRELGLAVSSNPDLANEPYDGWEKGNDSMSHRKQDSHG